MLCRRSRTIPANEDDFHFEDLIRQMHTDNALLLKARRYSEKGDAKKCRELVYTYFYERENAFFIFDDRRSSSETQKPFHSIYQYQLSLGYRGDDFEGFVRDFAERYIEEKIYTIVGSEKIVNLDGKPEHLPRFNLKRDAAKRHRKVHDMFVRGHLIEALILYYGKTKSEKARRAFLEFMKLFWREYPLKVENFSSSASKFMITQDRDVMSAGWLLFNYMNLLYSQLLYDCGADFFCEVLSHIYFLSLQFTRFNEDSYRPYNHHLWERGIVPYALSLVFSEFAEFAALKLRARDIINKHVTEDFNDAGGYSEHSLGYWAEAALGEMLFKAQIIASNNKEILLTDDAFAKIDKSFDVLATIAPPSACYPALGDKDGPIGDEILLLGEEFSGNEHCRMVRALRNGGLDHITLPPDFADEEAGFVSLRDNYSREASQLFMPVKVNAGGSGHNHMDLLSLNLTLHGEAVCGEPYAGHLYHTVRMGSEIRGFMYNMCSHNTVLVHGSCVQGNDKYKNRWGVYKPDSTLDAFNSYPEGAEVIVSHNAYTFCRHSRRIVFLRTGAVDISDRIIRGNRLKKAHIQRWYLHKGISAERLDEDMLLIQGRKVRMIWLFEGHHEIKIYKPRFLLENRYFRESDLADVIDVYFGPPEEQSGNPLLSELRLLQIDLSEQDTISCRKAIERGRRYLKNKERIKNARMTIQALKEIRGV